MQLAHEVLTCAELVCSDPSQISVPILMLHGDDDMFASHRATEEFWQAIKIESKRLMIINGGCHELHNDAKGEQWVHQIAVHLAKCLPLPNHGLTWLQVGLGTAAHLPAAQPA